MENKMKGFWGGTKYDAALIGRDGGTTQDAAPRDTLRQPTHHHDAPLSAFALVLEFRPATATSGYFNGTGQVKGETSRYRRWACVAC